MEETANFNSLIDKINRILESGEPDNISVDDYSGSTGYTPQYIIDALNTVIGIDKWGFDEISNELTGGETPVLAEAHIKVWLFNLENYRTAYGQARITRGDVGDARKGAQTDAIKKALSYFSIGNRAYLGLLGSGKGKKVTQATKVATTSSSDTKTRSDSTAKSTKSPTAGESTRKMYFAVAKTAGYESEKAKEMAKNAYKVESFTDLTTKQMQDLINWMVKKGKEVKQ